MSRGSLPGSLWKLGLGGSRGLLAVFVFRLPTTGGGGFPVHTLQTLFLSCPVGILLLEAYELRWEQRCSLCHFPSVI